jgi:ABC-type branched-subunit amino acid transport system ATPase component
MCTGTNLVTGEPLEIMNSQQVQEVYLGAEEDDDE